MLWRSCAAQVLMTMTLAIMTQLGNTQDYVRINCGGDALLSGWMADTGYDGGSSFLSTRTQPAGSFTSLDATLLAATVGNLTLSYRFQASWQQPFSYQLQLAAPAAEKVTVHLLFAESYQPAQRVGGRLMDIEINGRAVANNMDVFAMVGGDTAYVLSTPSVQPEAGRVVIEFYRSIFSSSDTVGPFVSAILVAPDLATTPLQSLSSTTGPIRTGDAVNTQPTAFTVSPTIPSLATSALPSRSSRFTAVKQDHVSIAAPYDANYTYQELLRINCGGEGQFDQLVRFWQSDQFFLNGKVRIAAEGTTFGDIYGTARQAGTKLRYTIPVPSTHPLLVRVHLAPWGSNVSDISELRVQTKLVEPFATQTTGQGMSSAVVSVLIPGSEVASGVLLLEISGRDVHLAALEVLQALYKPCTLSPCENQGTCENTLVEQPDAGSGDTEEDILTFRCTCPLGFFGMRCQNEGIQSSITKLSSSRHADTTTIVTSTANVSSSTVPIPTSRIDTTSSASISEASRNPGSTTTTASLSRTTPPNTEFLTSSSILTTTAAASTTSIKLNIPSWLSDSRFSLRYAVEYHQSGKGYITSSGTILGRHEHFGDCAALCQLSVQCKGIQLRQGPNNTPECIRLSEVTEGTVVRHSYSFEKLAHAPEATINGLINSGFEAPTLNISLGRAQIVRPTGWTAGPGLDFRLLAPYSSGFKLLEGQQALLVRGAGSIQQPSRWIADDGDYILLSALVGARPNNKPRSVRLQVRDNGQGGIVLHERLIEARELPVYELQRFEVGFRLRATQPTQLSAIIVSEAGGEHAVVDAVTLVTYTASPTSTLPLTSTNSLNSNLSSTPHIVSTTTVPSTSTGVDTSSPQSTTTMQIVDLLPQEIDDYTLIFRSNGDVSDPNSRRFTTSTDRSARLFSTNSIPECSTRCSASDQCNGLYLEVFERTIFCFGLNDIGYAVGALSPMASVSFQKFAAPGPCVSNPCRNGAGCDDTLGVAVCQCLPYTNGTLCEHLMGDGYPYSLDAQLGTILLDRGSFAGSISFQSTSSMSLLMAAIQDSRREAPKTSVFELTASVNLQLIGAIDALQGKVRIRDESSKGTSLIYIDQQSMRLVARSLSSQTTTQLDNAPVVDFELVDELLLYLTSNALLAMPASGSRKVLTEQDCTRIISFAGNTIFLECADATIVGYDLAEAKKVTWNLSGVMDISLGVQPNQWQALVQVNSQVLWTTLHDPQLHPICPQNTTSALFVGDINKDGLEDILCSQESTTYFRFGVTDPGYLTTSTVLGPLGLYINGIVDEVADINMDGVLDFLVLDEDYLLRLVLGIQASPDILRSNVPVLEPRVAVQGQALLCNGTVHSFGRSQVAVKSAVGAPVDSTALTFQPTKEFQVVSPSMTNNNELLLYILTETTPTHTVSITAGNRSMHVECVTTVLDPFCLLSVNELPVSTEYTVSAAGMEEVIFQPATDIHFIGQDFTTSLPLLAGVSVQTIVSTSIDITDWRVSCKNHLAHSIQNETSLQLSMTPFTPSELSGSVAVGLRCTEPGMATLSVVNDTLQEVFQYRCVEISQHLLVHLEQETYLDMSAYAPSASHVVTIHAINSQGVRSEPGDLSCSADSSRVSLSSSCKAFSFVEQSTSTPHAQVNLTFSAGNATVVKTITLISPVSLRAESESKVPEVSSCQDLEVWVPISVIAQLPVGIDRSLVTCDITTAVISGLPSVEPFRFVDGFLYAVSPTTTMPIELKLANSTLSLAFTARPGIAAVQASPLSQFEASVAVDDRIQLTQQLPKEQPAVVLVAGGVEVSPNQWTPLTTRPLVEVGIVEGDQWGITFAEHDSNTGLAYLKPSPTCDLEVPLTSADAMLMPQLVIQLSHQHILATSQSALSSSLGIPTRVQMTLVSQYASGKQITLLRSDKVTVRSEALEITWGSTGVSLTSRPGSYQNTTVEVSWRGQRVVTSIAILEVAQLSFQHKPWSRSGEWTTSEAPIIPKYARCHDPTLFRLVAHFKGQDTEPSVVAVDSLITSMPSEKSSELNSFLVSPGCGLSIESFSLEAVVGALRVPTTIVLSTTTTLSVRNISIQPMELPLKQPSTIIASAILSDGSEVLDVFGTGWNEETEALSATASNTALVDVNRITGEVSPVATSFQYVTIRVEADTGAVERVRIYTRVEVEQLGLALPVPASTPFQQITSPDVVSIPLVLHSGSNDISVFVARVRFEREDVKLSVGQIEANWLGIFTATAVVDGFQISGIGTAQCQTQPCIVGSLQVQKLTIASTALSLETILLLDSTFTLLSPSPPTVLPLEAGPDYQLTLPYHANSVVPTQCSNLIAQLDLDQDCQLSFLDVVQAAEVGDVEKTQQLYQIVSQRHIFASAAQLVTTDGCAFTLMVECISPEGFSCADEGYMALVATPVQQATWINNAAIQRQDEYFAYIKLDEQGRASLQAASSFLSLQISLIVVDSLNERVVQFPEPLHSDTKVSIPGQPDLQAYIPSIYSDPLIVELQCNETVRSRTTTATDHTQTYAIVAAIIGGTFFIVLVALLIFRSRARRNTFYVKVMSKESRRAGNPSHPWFGRGADVGFAVARPGRQYQLGRELRLVRGETYTFKMVDVSQDYPFYLSSSDVGGGNSVAEFLRSVVGTPAMENDVVTFTPTMDCPDLLYYQCSKQKCMGYIIRVLNSANAEVKEAPDFTTAQEPVLVFEREEMGLHDEPLHQLESLLTSFAQTDLERPALGDAVESRVATRAVSSVNSEPLQPGPRLPPLRSTNERATRKAPAYAPPPTYSAGQQLAAAAAAANNIPAVAYMPPPPYLRAFDIRRRDENALPSPVPATLQAPFDAFVNIDEDTNPSLQLPGTRSSCDPTPTYNEDMHFAIATSDQAPRRGSAIIRRLEPRSAQLLEFHEGDQSLA